MMGEISDEELEQKLRAKWGAGTTKPKPILQSATEIKIAEKLLGRDEAERLQRRPSNAGKFRPAPVSLRFEYHRVGGLGNLPDTLRITRIENGRASDHEWNERERTASQELVHLRRQGFRTQEFIPGPLSNPVKAPPPPPSRRKATLDRLRSFKL